MRMLALLTLVALTLASTATRAQGFLYLGAGISQNKLDDIGNSISHLDNTSWKALVGVRPIRYLGVEADYLDLGSHTDQYLSTTTHSDARALAAFAVGFLPIPVISFLDVYAKAGLARWQLHQNTNDPLSPNYYHFSNDGTDFAWGLGAQAHFGNIGARLEYEEFSVANTNGARVFSLDFILSLF